MEHSLLIFASISLLCVFTNGFIDVPEDSGIKMEAVPPTVNILELDKDNFHDVVDRHSDKHVVVEIYSSKSWCGKKYSLYIAKFTILRFVISKFECIILNFSSLSEVRTYF